MSEKTKLSQNVIELMNSWGLWVIAIIIISIVILQAFLYTRLAFKSAKQIDFPKEKCIQGFKSGMISSIGPATAVFIVMVGMISLIGGPVTWMWLTMIGSAATKLTAAQLSSEAMGVTLGSSNFTDIALANAYWAMSINGVGWLLVVGFMTHKMERVRQKIGGGDPKWLALFGIAASISAFAFLNIDTIYKSIIRFISTNNSIESLAPSAAVIGGILGMLILQKLGKKILWLREYALGIAMIIGIMSALIIKRNIIMNNISDFKNSWNPSAIKIGRATVLPIVFLCFLPSIYLYLFHGVYPPIHTMLQTWGLVLIVFAAFYFIEPLSYYPILGLAGTYMAFLSGNISNMRLPCSAVAQEVVGVKPETPEAQIISTLGISGSIVTNIIAITIAVLIGPYILNLFPEKIIEGFKAYAAPAIFGAVFGQFAFASIRTGIISLLIPSVIYIVGTISGINFILQSWFIITITILLTVTITRILYNKKRKALEEN